MRFECKGLATQHSNMVAPQVSEQEEKGEKDSVWTIVRMKKKRKNTNDLKVPGNGKIENMYKLPYEEASSSNHLESENEDENLEDKVKGKDTTTPKPFIRLRKVTPTKPRKPLFIDLTIDDDEDDEIEDDEISGVTENSHEKNISFFGNSDSEDEDKEEKALIAARRASRAMRKKAKLQKKIKEEEEMDEIIKIIEEEGAIDINKMHREEQTDQDLAGTQKTPPTYEVAMAAHVHDPELVELKQVTSVKVESDDPEDNDNPIDQQTLRSMVHEIDVLDDIDKNLQTMNLVIKEAPTQRNHNILNVAMDMSHMKDNADYKEKIKSDLPRLHDNIFPVSLREMSYMGDVCHSPTTDWEPDGIERGLELERIEASLFYHQLKLHGMDNSFKELFSMLNEMWDAHGIPYNKRYNLLLVEVEMVSLLMCDILPCNYSEQGLWVDDPSQGKYYEFFKDKNVETGRKKWYDLLGKSTYDWFWNVYSNGKPIASLNDEEVVMLSDIFDIIKFIHPTAINMLLNDATVLRKHMFIIEKANKCKHWIPTRHHLFYIWLFYGFRTLPTRIQATIQVGTISLQIQQDGYQKQ